MPNRYICPDKRLDISAHLRVLFYVPTKLATHCDQRTAINLAGDWLWLGFADFQAFDKGRYYGWVVAINPGNLSQQLYQPMVSLNSSNTWGIFAGGVWGPGGVAAAADGTVY